MMLPLVVVFCVSILLIVVGKHWMYSRWNMDYMVLLVGDLILFAASLFSFRLYIKALRDSNPQVFLRMLYSSLLVKMFFVLGATLIYLFFAGKEVNKAAILGCFVLYIIYTYVEVKTLMRMFKNLPRNA